MDGDVKKFKIKKTTDDYTEWNPEFTVEKELKRTNSGFPYHVSIIQDWDGTCDDPEYYFRLVPVHECFYGSDFLPVEVEGGVGDFTWSIVGDGFSLTTETTSARTNAVSADDTVELNDEATLTVEDSCGTIITTKLRACPYGSDDIPIHDDCTGVTMGYETLTPGFGSVQTLTALGAQEGVTYYWFMAGEGSLSTQEGNSVTYTAGSTTGIGFVILSGGVEHHNCAQNTFVGHVAPVCDCTGISISYTTQQMAVDEEQNLSVTGAVSGCTYSWGLSGGGSLSVAEGISTIYTAASSKDCENNPTITLSVNGSECDSLYIVVAGQWVLKSNACGLSGVGELTVIELNFNVDLISGLKRQLDVYTYHSVHSDKDDDAGCVDSIDEVCVGSQSCLTFTLPCNDIWGGSSYTCGDITCWRQCSKIPYTNTYRLSYVYYTCTMYYYEWECV